MRLNDPSGDDSAPITLISQILPAGFGFDGDGAIWNMAGFNTLTGQVALQTNVGIRTDDSGILESPDSLTISGQVTNAGAGSEKLTKLGNLSAAIPTGTGNLILTHSNTYTGGTTIQAGILDITDSQALGPKGTAGLATVAAGATLEFYVDSKVDSLTTTTNTLTVYTPLSISGSGTSNQGALYSATGINTYFGAIASVPDPTGVASIGVDPDPNQTANTAYFANDYSLSLGTLAAGGGQLSGNNTVTVEKLGNGQLIVPNAENSFSGAWDIQSGWLTIENDNSLGATLPNTSQNNQPTTTVEDGAALHLMAQSGENLDIDENLALTGEGISHAFSLINQAGAVENLAGINTLDGNIRLAGQAAIGVQAVFGPSQLTTIGTISQEPPQIVVHGNPGSGNGLASSQLIRTGTTTGGTLTLDTCLIPSPTTCASILAASKTILHRQSCSTIRPTTATRTCPRADLGCRSLSSTVQPVRRSRLRMSPSSVTLPASIITCRVRAPRSPIRQFLRKTWRSGSISLAMSPAKMAPNGSTRRVSPRPPSPAA